MAESKYQARVILQNDKFRAVYVPNNSKVYIEACTKDALGADRWEGVTYIEGVQPRTNYDAREAAIYSLFVNGVKP